jgi:alpha-amylase/alpha-mannosidase (GH57 family)
VTDVAILWHMHQPRYVHPMTGRPVLPWVRLHAASGYLDMARALERRPGARVTVNFVPSLVDQIDQLVNGARDALEELAEKPAADLVESERLYVLARSFSARRDRAIDARPRFAELLAKRGDDTRPEPLAVRARRFTAEEIRDVECLYMLAWLGFAAREDDPEIDALDTKGRAFTEEDKGHLLLAIRRAAGAVIPAWRRLAERGQVELAASPYYHPIVPLLIDTDTARRARPDDPVPLRFLHADDAEAQIRRAQESHARTFGAPPRGMWPPEGSLSPEAVALYGACGVAWLCGDDEVLRRSLGQPGGATQVWRWDGVDIVFRNRDLSDRIGFRYADVPAATAAADLVASARAAGDGVVGVFLDGENAWEAYPHRGADFLDALYARLEEGHPVRARTLSEAIAEHGPGRPLPRLHSGSWIDASFRIWIGDPLKNRAWGELANVRHAVAQTAAGGDSRGAAAAMDLLLAAEGSDWFWWYGEPFSSAEDPIFDELFRVHVEGAWRAIGREPPASLDEPIGGKAQTVRQATPTATIHPRIDGRASLYYEWFGAALHEVGRGAAMADSGHPIDRLYLGFGDDALYLRIDPHRGDRAKVNASWIVLHLKVGDTDRTVRIAAGLPAGGQALAELGGMIGVADVIELALPLAPLGAKPRDSLRVWMTFEVDGLTFARVPRDGVISAVVPWPGWEDENWTV